MAEVTGAFRLTDDERKRFREDGYLIREGAFAPEETARISRHCEQLMDEVMNVKVGQKHAVGSFLFEVRPESDSIVKWEPNAPGVVQGIESFGHLYPPLFDFSYDARFLDPARDMIEENDITLFTEKLNLKRAREGGVFILHQDFPYWQLGSPVANRIVTAMMMLDDATVENGCLEVAPGSHREGVLKVREVDGFGSNEMDEDAFDLTRLRPVEAKAGSIIFFGAFMAHRSRANHSERDRRALFYSYQPAGNPSARELLRMQMGSAEPQQA